MTDLEAAIPPVEPADGALAFVAGLGLDAIPIVGPMAGRALDHALATRERERRLAFDRLVISELQSLAARVSPSLTVEEVVSSDEFLAAYTRTSRRAAESASVDKRRRLATSAAQAGTWSGYSAAERQEFSGLVEVLEDLHVWLLHFFVSPWHWLLHNGMIGDGNYGPIEATVSSPSRHLALALGVSELDWGGPTDAALAALHRHGLTDDVPLRTGMSGRSAAAERTTTKGRRFLDFLHEPDSAAMVPPDGAVAEGTIR